MLQSTDITETLMNECIYSYATTFIKPIFSIFNFAYF